MNCETNTEDHTSTTIRCASHAPSIAVLQRLHDTLSRAPDGHADELAALAVAVRGLSELDNADRIAGSAMRQLEAQAAQIHRYNLWLAEAKAEAGFEPSTSFDVVWSQTLAQARGAVPPSIGDSKINDTSNPLPPAAPDYVPQDDEFEPAPVAESRPAAAPPPAAQPQRQSSGVVLLSNPSAYNQF